MSGTQGIRSGLARATQNVGNIIGDGRLEYLGIGLLFAVGGIWTKVVIDQRVPAGSGFPFVYATLVLAVAPFAAICALLFARTWRIIIAALLLGAVFLAAMTVAEFLAIKSAKRVSGFAFAMFSAGLIGGTGVVLSLAACNRSLLSFACIWKGALVGCLAAFPFAAGGWLEWRYVFPLGYATWQAAVGSFLYVVCRRESRATLSGRHLRWAILTLSLATVIGWFAYDFGPTNYYVPAVKIGKEWQIKPVGTHSLSTPSARSYYFFFHAARLTSVSHSVRGPGDSEPHTALYLETKPEGPLDRTVKSDALLAGDFGLVDAEKTCFYNRPVESNYSSVKTSFHANEYRSSFENPVELAAAPEILPPLTSISLVKLFRDGSEYTLAGADYEATGERRSLHVSRAAGGKLLPGADAVMFHLGSKDPRLAQYGIPDALDINSYLASHRLLGLGVGQREAEVWLIQFYDFGKRIQLQELRDGVPISSRWVRPSITDEERTLGPECDSRMRRQKAMGLPTTGY